MTELGNDKQEGMRRLVDLALDYGKKKQSPQTGYVHYYYQGYDDEVHLPIPIVENLLFSLALLRTRLAENVLEARKILGGILPFQNLEEGTVSYGNFPLYMHDFPQCKDRQVAVHASAPLFWILKLFGTVLGNDLKVRLEKALLSAVRHAVKSYHEKPMLYPVAVKVGAAAKAVGNLLGDESLENEGQLLLNSLVNCSDRMSWYCPESIAMIFTSLSMVYTSLKNGPWDPFWRHLENTWHRDLCAYCGPVWQEWQREAEPKATVYDLLLGALSGRFSCRALKESIAHLEAALVFLLSTELSETGERGEFSTSGYYCGSHYAYQFMQRGELTPLYIKAFQPFRILWGDKNRLHSFVSQSKCDPLVEVIAPDEISLLFTLEGSADVEDKEKNREILFFVDAHENLEFFVSEKKASTFQLDDTLRLCSPGMELTLSFQLEKGDGKFFGHRMLGNRSSHQQSKKGNQYEAFDWMLFFRTVRRDADCQVRVKINRIGKKDITG